MFAHTINLEERGLRLLFKMDVTFGVFSRILPLFLFLPNVMSSCSVLNIKSGHHEVSRQYDRDSVAEFSCEESYALFGPKYSICNKNGNWVPHPPKCYKKCEKPSDPNVIFEGKFETRHSLSIKVRCKPGYSLPNGGKATCMNGTWRMGEARGIYCSLEEISPTSTSITTRPNKRASTSTSTVGGNSEIESHQNYSETGKKLALQQDTNASPMVTIRGTWCLLANALVILLIAEGRCIL